MLQPPLHSGPPRSTFIRGRILQVTYYGKRLLVTTSSATECSVSVKAGQVCFFPCGQQHSIPQTGAGAVAEEKVWWPVSPLPVSVPLITDTAKRNAWAPLTKREQGTEGAQENDVRLWAAPSMVRLPLNSALSTAPAFHDLLQRLSSQVYPFLQNLTEAGEFLFHLYKRIKRAILTKPRLIASL